MAVDINVWLEQLGLGKYADRFAENEIDFDAARDLTEEDLKELGIPMGPRKKLLRALAETIEASNNWDEGTAKAASGNAPDPVRTLDAERRHMTVMFCDLVGSTELATVLDPEDMHSLLGVFQETCGRIAADHGGHIAKLLGDGLLVYFGYPRASEDDAERAVRAGLEIVDAVRRIETPLGGSLQSRIGLASGIVVIGDITSGGAGDPAAVSGLIPHLRSLSKRRSARFGMTGTMGHKENWAPIKRRGAKLLKLIENRPLSASSLDASSTIDCGHQVSSASAPV